MYRIHDQDREQGCHFVEREEAAYWNSKGWGIFDCPNPVEGKRCSANVTAIKFWFVDIDTGTKEEQMLRIRRSPLFPTWVVETVRGYHVYWRAKGASLGTWKDIVSHRLIPFFNADRQASDMSRLLRVPGYYHRKGEPFLVSIVQEHDIAYTEDELLFMFPESKPAQVEREARQASDGDFWGRVSNLDCGEGLLRLSGHPAVNHEVYELRRAGAKGNLNLYVNGRSTSCFVDQHGKIGSYSGGGPNLFHWLSWYGHSPAEVAKIIKEVFPELKEVAA